MKINKLIKFIVTLKKKIVRKLENYAFSIYMWFCYFIYLHSFTRNHFFFLSLLSIRLDGLRPKVAAIVVQPMVEPMVLLAMPAMSAVLQNLYLRPPLATTALNDWLLGVLLLVLRLSVACKTKKNIYTLFSRSLKNSHRLFIIAVVEIWTSAKLSASSFIADWSIFWREIH